MRRFLNKDGSYILSKVQRTTIFDNKTGVNYPDGHAIAHVTLDELEHFVKEAKKRINSIRKSQGPKPKFPIDSCISRLDNKLTLYISEGQLPRLKPEKNQIPGVKLSEDLGEMRRKCLKKKSKKKKSRATSKRTKKSKSAK